MEVLYKRLFFFRDKVIEYWAIYFVSVVMNFLSDKDVIDGTYSFWHKMTDIGNSAVLILVVLTVLMIVFYLLLAVSGYLTRTQEPEAVFTLLMRAHSDEFAHAKIAGGLIWGQDRTLWTAPNIIIGVKPDNVKVVNYDSTPFTFSEKGLEEEFQSFENAERFKQTKALGNDLPRYMLTRYGQNYNKENPVLVLHGGNRAVA